MSPLKEDAMRRFMVSLVAGGLAMSLPSVARLWVLAYRCAIRVE